jgi:hypothetical protein
MKTTSSRNKGAQAASELTGLSKKESSVRLDEDIGVPIYRRDLADDEKIMKWGLHQVPNVSVAREERPQRGFRWKGALATFAPKKDPAPITAASLATGYQYEPLSFQMGDGTVETFISRPEPLIINELSTRVLKAESLLEQAYVWSKVTLSDRDFLRVKKEVETRGLASRAWLSGRDVQLAVTADDADAMEAHQFNSFVLESLAVLAWMHQASRLDRYQVTIEIRKRFAPRVGRVWVSTDEIIQKTTRQGALSTKEVIELYANPPEVANLQEEGTDWTTVVTETRSSRNVHAASLVERVAKRIQSSAKDPGFPPAASIKRVLISDSSKVSAGVSYAQRAGFAVVEKELPDHEFSQWELIHVSAARHHVDRGRVNIDRTGHGSIIRFTPAIHWPPPRGTSKMIAYRITLGRDYVQRQGKGKYVLIVTHAYHLLSLTTGGKPMHPKARRYLLSHANVFVVNLRHDAGPPEDLRLLDFMPPGRMIKTQLGVHSTPLDLFMRLHDFFMNEEDKKWAQLLTALLTDHVGLTLPEYAVVLRVLNEGIEKNWRSRGRSVFAHISPTNRWRFGPDGRLRPSPPVMYGHESGRNWMLNPLDLILYSPIVSPVVETFSHQGLSDVDPALSTGTEILMALEESGFAASFPTIIKIISFLVIGSEIRTMRSWIALVVLSVPEIPEKMSHCLPIVASAIARFRRACSTVETEWFALQSGSDIPQSEESAFARLKAALFGPQCLGFLSTELGSALWEVVSAFSVIGVFASSGIMGSPYLVRTHMRELSQLLKNSAVPGTSSLESFVERCVRFITIFVERLHTAITKRDWTELFKDDLTAGKWTAWVDTLINDETIRFDPGRPSMAAVFKTSRSLGLLPPQFVKTLDVDERVAMAREALKAADHLSARYAGDRFILLAIKHKVAELRNEERALVATSANSSYRLVPWGLFIHGAPGVGKTSLCAKLHAVIGEHLGFKGDETTMYRMDPGSNFHDTFHNDQWGALLDDIDQSMARPTAGVPNHAEIVNKFVNSAPFSMERADISEKGKFFANFLAVYYATNFADAKLKEVSECPIQFHRRFPVRVEMRVKEEFADAAGGLHRERAYLNGSLRPNPWYFIVRVYDPTFTSTDRYELPYGEPRTYTDECSFLAAMSLAFKNHYDREVAYNATRRTPQPQDSGVCQHCLQALDKHSNGRACIVETFKLQSLSVSDLDLLFRTGAMIFTAWYVGSWIARHVDRALHWAQNLPPDFREVAELWVLRQVTDHVGYPILAWHYGPIWVRKTVYKLTHGDSVQKVMTFAMDHYKAIAVALSTLLIGLPLARRYLTKEREKLMQQGLSASLPTGLPKRRDPWVTLAPTLFEREYSRVPKKTYTLEEFGAIVRKRIYPIRGAYGLSFGVALGGGAFLFNKHALFPSGSVEAKDVRPVVELPSGATLDLEVGTAWVHIILDPRKTTLIEGRDIVVTWLPEAIVLKTKWDLLEELPPTCLARQGNRPDQSFLVTRDALVVIEGRMQGVPGYAKTGAEANYSWEHQNVLNNGDCGTPLIARFGDRFFLVGIHGVSRVREQFGTVFKSSRAESLSLDELRVPIQAARDQRGSSMEVVLDPEMIEPGSDGFTLQGLPVRSSLRVSMNSAPLAFYLLGTYTGKQKLGNTMGSRIVPTGFSDPVLKELKLAALGKEDDFAPPNFHGSMGISSYLGGTGFRWNDPHTRSMEAYRNIGGRSDLWDLAKADYLTDVEKLPGSSGIVPLSDWAAVKGVPGSTCGGFDLTTSAGPPFFGPKKICVFVNENTDPPTVVIDPELRRGMDRILEVIDAGDVYSPPAIHCLKDEVTTILKNRAHKVRVFNIMPFAFNVLLKKYIGPIACFYREHPLFFEHAVGLNIACEKDATMMHSFLTVFELVLASDVTDFDVAASTRELYAASEVVHDLGRLLGYTILELRRLWGLLMSAMHVTHINKGDFWMTNHGLPSGYWITLFLNCIRNSLQARYAYYALAPGKVGVFRDNVKMLVLGDDNIGCVRRALWWYNQITVAAALLEIGAKRTSSVKGRELTEFEKFAEATFLKRVFRRLEGMIVCPIEKKTLVRMLSYRRKTGLSTHDHLCVIVSTVLSEAWMWGEEFFSVMLGLCERLAAAHELGGRNLRIDTFAGYVSRYRAGELCVWSPLVDEQTQLLLT